MRKQQTPKAILFLDFDGTISSSDAVDVILETYADLRWLVFEEEWRAGRMGSRDCLRAQMALVRATHDELNTLLDQIAVDEGLARLLEMCAAHDVPVHIVSDGFDYCIRRILSHAGDSLQSLMRGVRIAASRLESQGHLWRTAFPFAESADLVFAKNGLARYCRGQSIEHISYNNLEDVAVYLEGWLAARTFIDDEMEQRASA